MIEKSFFIKKNSRKSSFLQPGKDIQQEKSDYSIPTEPSKLQFYNLNINSNIQESLPTLLLNPQKLILQGSSGILWSDQFAKNIAISTFDFNGQSSSILLHYGNYQMKASVIFTQLDESILTGQIFDSGSFGSIYSLNDSGGAIIIKGVSYVTYDGRFSTAKIYKEYFMAKISQSLKAGPKIKKFFGYDIVFFKNQACFAMQKCSQSFTNLEKTQKDLLNNLKRLHSVGFIHLDIKPDNTAYSHEFNRFVFIDFGFSKLISEPLGRKTFSLFYGTLSYCSEQMKDIYYSGFPAYVDLYYNDIVSLRKSFSKKKKYYQIFKKLLEDKISIESKQVDTPASPFLVSTFLLLRVKYYLWDFNISQVIPLCQSNHRLHFSLCEVLSHQLSIYPNQPYQNDLKKLLTYLKQTVKNQNIIVSPEDSYFTKLFKQKNGPFLCPISLSIQQILQLPQQKFEDYAENVQWIQKLFCVLDPLSNFFPQTNDQQFFSYVYRQRMKVVDKIYHHLLRLNRVRANNIQTYRSWVVIMHIYGKLKPLRILSSLFSLRLMFILLADLQRIEEISFEIAECIKDQKQRLLTIAQFQLFLDVGLKCLQPVNQRYLSYTEKTNGQKSAELNLIRTFTRQILQRERKCNQINSKERIYELLSQIQQIQIQSESLTTIRYLYGYLAKTVPLPQQNEKNQKKTANLRKIQFSQKVYSVYFDTFPSSCLQRKWFYYFSQLFKPMGIQDYLSCEQEKLVHILKQMFQIKKEMQKTWVNFICINFDEIILRRPKLLLQIIIFCKQLNMFASKSRINAYYMLRNIFWLINLLNKYICSVYSDLKVESGVQVQILAQTEMLFRGFSLKMQDHMKEQWVLMSFECFEGIFLFLKKSSNQRLQQKAKQISLRAQNIYQMETYTINYFLSFFACFYWQIRNEPGQHFIQKYVIRITQVFFEKGQSTVLKSNNRFMSMVILINWKNGSHDANINLIKAIKGKQRAKLFDPERWYMIQQTLSTLIFCTPRPFLEDYFNSLKKKSIDAMMIQQIEIQFHLFSNLAKCCTHKIIRKQIVRLFTCLRRLRNLEKRIMQKGLYKIWRQSMKGCSKRKKFVCLKREKNRQQIFQRVSLKFSKSHEDVKALHVNKFWKVNKNEQF